MLLLSFLSGFDRQLPPLDNQSKPNRCFSLVDNDSRLLLSKVIWSSPKLTRINIATVLWHSLIRSFPKEPKNIL
ncbi:hypothetical protein CMV_020726 [Castanea mollissima]|uniref:Uncharacterized protein n=1 Tax=Castanea mollissima TaxID=60419 RepID=A0A8J4VDC2_9ROSI|nr:hypothetical protein CMV_020726 [Castanea mollissima]